MEDDWEDEGDSEPIKHKKGEKVEIHVTEGHRFDKCHLDGCEYTGVDYNGRTYGGGSPCTTPEEIASAIEHAKKTIKEMGDIPVLKDERKAATLSAWGFA